jgi:hypothetical protein
MIRCVRLGALLPTPSRSSWRNTNPSPGHDRVFAPSAAKEEAKMGSTGVLGGITLHQIKGSATFRKSPKRGR